MYTGPGVAAASATSRSALIASRRIEHRAVRHAAHHREILERHLRRAVLADRHAGVRAGELHVEVRDAGHADEVAGALEKARERRRKRDRAAAARPIATPTIACSAMNVW